MAGLVPNILSYDKMEADATKKKRLLKRGPTIQVENQVSRSDVTGEEKGIIKNVTYPANVRVDNHVRNQISALQNLGLGSSAKDIVQDLLAEKVEQLDSPTAKRYQEMVDILEQMDAYKQTEKVDKGIRENAN